MMQYLNKPFFQIGFFIALSALFIPTSYADFKKGIEAALKSNNDLAIKEFRKAAEAGHAAAQFELASRLSDKKEREFWYQKAIDQGVASAAFVMASTSGDCCELSHMKLFEIAAKAGVIGGMVQLKIAYSEQGESWGYPYKVDEDLSNKWLLEAAKHGDFNTNMRLAMGNEPVPNLILLNQTDNRNETINSHKTLMFQMNTTNMVLDGDEVRELSGSYMLANVFVMGDPRDNGKFANESYKMMLSSAQKGHAVAQNWIGNCYLQGCSEGVSIDYEKAFSWYLKSANSGHVDSLVQVGDMFLTGQGTDQDYRKSLEWYRKAAQLGAKFSPGDFVWVAENYLYPYFKIGLIHYHGLGVERDEAKALDYIRHAYLNSNERRLEISKFIEENELWGDILSTR